MTTIHPPSAQYDARQQLLDARRRIQCLTGEVIRLRSDLNEAREKNLALNRQLAHCEEHTPKLPPIQ